jgi:hypothetical protein
MLLSSRGPYADIREDMLPQLSAFLFVLFNHEPCQANIAGAEWLVYFPSNNLSGMVQCYVEVAKRGNS